VARIPVAALRERHRLPWCGASRARGYHPCSMNLSDIRHLFAYTEWANDRIVECVRGLSDEQYARMVPSSFPAIRDTLAHIVMAEWIWLRRWKGESPRERPQWSVSEPALDVVVENLRAVERERAALLDTLTDAELQKDLSYRNMAGEPFTNRLGELMSHVVNHSTYHRGQLTTMIRQVGATPPSTDLVNFLRGIRK
jgi:uncharacterized damage-inducible protein DinB